IYTADGRQKKAGSPGARDGAVTLLAQTRGGEVSCALGHPASRRDPHGAQEYTMSPHTPDAKHHAKARRRRYRTAQKRLAHDRRQAQRAAEALEHALQALGFPEHVVAEIEGRIRSQQKLLGKIVGVMCPPLFGCRTNTELCRVRGWVAL